MAGCVYVCLFHHFFSSLKCSMAWEVVYGIHLSKFYVDRKVVHSVKLLTARHEKAHDRWSQVFGHLQENHRSDCIDMHWKLTNSVSKHIKTDPLNGIICLTRCLCSESKPPINWILLSNRRIINGIKCPIYVDDSIWFCTFKRP